MASIFDKQNVSYAFEKLYDFINQSGSGVVFAPASANIIVETLEALKGDITKRGFNPEESALPTALYAARELQKFVNKQPSDIPNRTAARVFVTALEADVLEMRRYEKSMEASA